MAEKVLAPDLYLLVKDILNPLAVPVSYRVPNPRPAEFVRVSPVPSDGFRGRVLFAGRVVVEVWAASQVRALTLAREAEALLSAPSPVVFADCQGPGIYPPDPDTGTPKAGFAADVFARGSLTT